MSAWTQPTPGVAHLKALKNRRSTATGLPPTEQAFKDRMAGVKPGAGHMAGNMSLFERIKHFDGMLIFLMMYASGSGIGLVRMHHADYR